jgi:hypothetical protein
MIDDVPFSIYQQASTSMIAQGSNNINFIQRRPQKNTRAQASTSMIAQGGGVDL